MKFFRILVPVLLLFMAVPAFSLCTLCWTDCSCIPGDNVRCKQDIDCCYTVTASCYAPGDTRPDFLAQTFVIASYEVTTPAQHEVTVTAAPSRSLVATLKAIRVAARPQQK